jgi:hypothetical protein
MLIHRWDRRRGTRLPWTVQTAFPNASLMASPQAGVGIKQDAFVRACADCSAGLGLERGKDVNTGPPTGVWVTPLVSIPVYALYVAQTDSGVQSIDPARTDRCSSSPEAYLTPVEHTLEN